MKPRPPKSARTPEKKPSPARRKAFTACEANQGAALCQSRPAADRYHEAVKRVFLCAPVIVLALAACRDSSSSSGGAPSNAEIRWHDGGPPDLALGDRVMPLPSGELADAARPTITQDAQGKRIAYPLASGESRLVYVVGDNLYLGPRTKAPLDFATAPDLDHALGALFENAGPRRGALAADVNTAKGEAGVVHLLVDGASVEGREWDDAYAKLPGASAAEVKSGLAVLLEKGKPTAGLRRAVAVVPLRERAPAALAARIRELADPMREPRAAAVMLRALATSDKAQAGTVACEVLDHKPLDLKAAKGTPQEIDGPGREALAEAALLAIAASGTECKHVTELLGEDTCTPAFRCSPAGPLDGRETSKQDEPLCTKEQLSAAVAKDLERAPADVLGLTNGARPQLFAFAALESAGKVPPMFVTAHARRRYPLVQPAEPACETGGPPGSPCHCDEATIRDQTCRHPESKTVSVGVCKFEIDDKQKKILNVVVTTPP